MQGIKTDWSNLPKRKCDNCGAMYRPKRPLQPGERGFCSDNHRKEYHKHGGSYGKLKPFIEREIKKRIKELSPADASRMEAFEQRLNAVESSLELIRLAVSGFQIRT